MITIVCPAERCLHNYHRTCDVNGQIDMHWELSDDDRSIIACLDYTPLTDEEYYKITGKNRK